MNNENDKTQAQDKGLDRKVGFNRSPVEVRS